MKMEIIHRASCNIFTFLAYGVRYKQGIELHIKLIGI